MKLIDLLVQELPKRGGWPEGAESVVQDADDSEFYFFTGGPVKNSGKSWWFVDSDNRDDNSKWIFFEGKNDIADDCNSAIVTRAQYESALAASQKPAWNGEGLPPIGCECEVSVDGGRSWCTYRAINEKNGVRLIEIGNLTEEFENDNWIFRPLHTEAERKRDEAVEAIDFYMPEFIPDTPNEFYHAKRIYDAIAAGKIPGVKLDD